MIECIICQNPNEAKSVEHIVSESFGNKDYTIDRSRICDECNARFSKFEGVALTNSVFVMERARFGIETKKGKNVKGKVGGIAVVANKDFEKNRLTLTGLSAENLTIIDPNQGIAQVFVQSFDKSEVATSKLLLKTGIESLFQSRRDVYRNHDFSNLRDFLLAKDNRDWPFITSGYEENFESVPRFTDKHKLKAIKCLLRYGNLSPDTLLFKFQYGAISMVINLIERNLEWIADYLQNDGTARVYPEHYAKKVEKTKSGKRV